MNYYTFQPVKMHRNILLRMKKVQMGKLVILCENSAHTIRGKFNLWNVSGWVNGLLTDLWVTAQIGSLPEVKLPIIVEGESQSDRLNKTIFYEWGTARLELDFLLGDPLGNWASFGETAIKNSNGYRYRKHRALDLITDSPGYTLEEGWKIACQLNNVGFGDLTDKDKLDLTGAWVQEFVAIQQQPPYVVNNLYGSGSSPSPSPSPSTTPTAIPTFTLAYSSSSATTAISNTDEKLKLTITQIPNNNQLTLNWYKVVNNVDTNLNLSESIITNGNVLDISTLKFKDKGIGIYRFKVTYNGTEYTSTAVSITVNPEITTSPSSGTTGNNTQITVTGKYFTGASSRKYTFSWLDSNNSLVHTSPESTLTLNSNGEFTINIGLNTLQNQSTGTYRFRLNLDSDILGATILIPALNTIEVTITQPPTPTVTVTPASFDIASGNPTAATFSIQLTNMPFSSGNMLIEKWYKTSSPSTAVVTNSIVFSPGGTGGFTFTRSGSSFYSTTGGYYVEINLSGSTTVYRSNTIFFTNTAGGFG